MQSISVNQKLMRMYDSAVPAFTPNTRGGRNQRVTAVNANGRQCRRNEKARTCEWGF